MTVVKMEDAKKERVVEKARRYFIRKGNKASAASRVDETDGKNDGFYIRSKGRAYRVLACVNQAQYKIKNTFALTDVEYNWLKRPTDRVFLVQQFPDGSEKCFEVYKEDISLNDKANTDEDAQYKVYTSEILYPAE